MVYVYLYVHVFDKQATIHKITEVRYRVRDFWGGMDLQSKGRQNRQFWTDKRSVQEYKDKMRNRRASSMRRDS